MYTKSKLNLGRLLLAALICLPIPAAMGQGGPALVRVAIASQESMAPATWVPGTVISRNDARLSSEVEGRLIEVADVGTPVQTGETIARIEDTALKLQQAELAAQVRRAEASLRFLESEEKRFSRLAESNLAAMTQLEQTRSDRDIAIGDLEVARARLEQNADSLARTQIVAPYDGIVVERLMMPGERVNEGSQVVRLVDHEHLEVIARAPLEYYEYVQRGITLEVRSTAVQAEGTVRTVVAVGDENTHQFELRIDLEGKPYPVGKTVRVSIPTSDSRQVLAVPRDALVLRPEGESVFVVDSENMARQVYVSVGMGHGDYIEIMGDVSPGDRVVIRGNERLQPGQPVSIMDS